jgi:hypothetical protein
MTRLGYYWRNSESLSEKAINLTTQTVRSLPWDEDAKISPVFLVCLRVSPFPALLRRAGGAQAW